MKRSVLPEENEERAGANSQSSISKHREQRLGNKAVYSYGTDSSYSEERTS